MNSGWNLSSWLQCIGVASRCCCKEIYRYPHNIYIYNTQMVAVALGPWASHSEDRAEP